MKAARRYLHNRESAISVLLEKPRSKYTSGTFHLLRVEIKKLKALFDLIQYCSKNFNEKKSNKPFNLLFRQAGRVRELQLEEALLKRYQINNSLSDYLTGLRNRRLEETDQYFTLLNEETKPRLNKSFQYVVPFLSGLKNKKVVKYRRQKIKSIKKLINKATLQPKQLHKLRTRLKMLNYNQKSLAIEESPAQKSDVLPVLLGKWHDLEVMSLHLEKTIAAGGIKHKEIVQLGKINAVLSSKSEMLLEKIMKAIPKSEFYKANKETPQRLKKTPEEVA